MRSILSYLRRRPRDDGRPNPGKADLVRSIAGPRSLGYWFALAFFGGFGAWAVVAPLASAAIAPGVVSPDGARKTIQHLEGGIIRSIHVREGDQVQPGDILVTLENVTALARREELLERFVFLLAKEARLVAEEAEGSEIAFPRDLIEMHGDRGQLAIRSQTDLFENRRRTHQARDEILSKRISQLREQIAGLNNVIEAQGEQLKLLDEEIATSHGLYEKKLEKLSNLLTRQRERAEIDAERSKSIATVAELEQRVGETELQILAGRQQAREAVSEELSEVRAELAGVRSQLPQREDALARTVLTAPIAGRVMNVIVTTEIGGVLRPGDPVLDIVPESGKLIVDAHVRPIDIDNVAPGLRARIVLSAYSQRNLPYIYGTVRSVSADRLTDERTGDPFFLAKIEVDSQELENLGQEIELVAGMSADVLILTGERTLLDIVLQPVSDSFRYSFRE